jgi:uncharacterized cupin superfamily protein
MTLVRLRPDGDPVAGMAASHLTNPENFTGPDRDERSHAFFRRGGVSAGVWECAPCREDIASYGVDELCVILSGVVTVTPRGGAPETFRAGDCFAIGADFSGEWRIDERLRKFWMIVEPPAAGEARSAG